MSNTESPVATPAPFAVPAPAPENGYYVESALGCRAFQTIIGREGAVALDIDTLGPNTVVVPLARPFEFLGTDPVTTLVVTETGSINIRGSDLVGRGAVPIDTRVNERDPYTEVPRISIAQAAGVVVTRTPTSGVFALDTGASIVISWEDVSIPVRGTLTSFNFQAELFDDGNIEMTWDYTNSGTLTVAAGIEDPTIGASFPVTGMSFNDVGIGNPFMEEGCRRFTRIRPTPMPTVSAVPSKAPSDSPSDTPTTRPTTNGTVSLTKRNTGEIIHANVLSKLLANLHDRWRGETRHR